MPAAGFEPARREAPVLETGASAVPPYGRPVLPEAEVGFEPTPRRSGSFSICSRAPSPFGYSADLPPVRLEQLQLSASGGI